MPRYIDADELKEYLKDIEAQGNDRKLVKGLQDAIDYFFPQIIDDIPTADVQPVRHGRWEWEPGDVGTEARCSVCKSSPMGFYSLPTSQIGRLPEFPFCPKCGAKMGGGEQE